MAIKENEIKVEKKYKSNSQFSYISKFLKLSFEINFLVIVHLVKKFISLFQTQPEKIIAGQIALVTGGGNGLGKEISIQLAKKGCNVIVADVDIDAANDVANKLETNYNVKSKAYKLDVSNYDDVTKTASLIETEVGPVDILINNAGLMPMATLKDIEPAEVHKVVGVNLTSHFWTIQTYIKGMKERNRGHIVAICSIAGLAPVASGILYATTKHGVKGLMDSLTTELILENSNIKTTTVFPYFILTNKNLVDALIETNTFNKFPPMSPSKVAQQIVNAIVNDEEYIVIPGIFAKLLYFGSFIPKYILMPKLYSDMSRKVHRISKDIN